MTLPIFAAILSFVGALVGQVVGDIVARGMWRKRRRPVMVFTGGFEASVNPRRGFIKFDGIVDDEKPTVRQ